VTIRSSPMATPIETFRIGDNLQMGQTASAEYEALDCTLSVRAGAIFAMRASSFHAVPDSMSHSISTISAAKGHAGAGCQLRPRLTWMLWARAEAMPELPL
jgi:hypothetical protein